MTLTMIDEEEFSRLLALGDELIPAYRHLPQLSDTPNIGPAINRAMEFRPDLLDDLRRGLGTTKDLSALDAARLLFREDSAALSAIGAILSGAYLMTPHVRTLIGYPGQTRVERSTNDPSEIPTDEMMSRVRARGTTCRLTPQETASKE